MVNEGAERSEGSKGEGSKGEDSESEGNKIVDEESLKY